jgi:hypothetical protein
VLSHWREHIVESGADPEKVVAEWRFRFATATLSPKGYSRSLSFHHHAGEEVRLASDVGIFFRQGVSDHPLRLAVKELGTSIALLCRRLSQILVMVIVILAILVLKAVSH